MNISENLMQDQRDLISVGIVHQVPKMSFMTIDKEMDLNYTRKKLIVYMKSRFVVFVTNSVYTITCEFKKVNVTLQ